MSLKNIRMETYYIFSERYATIALTLQTLLDILITDFLRVWRQLCVKYVLSN